MRSYNLIISSLIGATIFLVGCTQDVTVKPEVESQSKEEEVIFPDFNPSIADGKVVWEKQKCAECHGAEGRGIIGKASDDLTDPRRRMSGRSPIYQYKLLAYGMPNWDHPKMKDVLSRREIWDLVFYVRSFESPPLTATEIAKLDDVFGANCADCHGIQGYGDGPLSNNLDPLPANFHQYNRFYDRDDPMLHIHVAEGLYPSAMPGFLGRQDRTNNVTFDDEYIDKLIKYVRHFSVGYKPTYLQQGNK